MGFLKPTTNACEISGSTWGSCSEWQKEPLGWGAQQGRAMGSSNGEQHREQQRGLLQSRVLPSSGAGAQLLAGLRQRPRERREQLLGEHSRVSASKGDGWVKATSSGFPIEVLFCIAHRMGIRQPCNAVSPLHTLPRHLQTLPNGGMALLGD